MKICTTGVVVAVLWIAAGVGCASAPSSGPASSPTGPPDTEVLRGPQLEGPDFNPRSADFTDWLDDFEKKTHHNWVPPTYFGYGGGVEFMFTVERNGSISMLDMVKSSGTETLDRAAAEALTRSKFESLPGDFGRARVTMRITFHYNPPPGE